MADVTSDYHKARKAFDRSLSLSDIPESIWVSVGFSLESRNVLWGTLFLQANWNREYNDKHPQEAAFSERIKDMQAALFKTRGEGAFRWVEAEEPGAYRKINRYDAQKRLHVVQQMNDFLENRHKPSPREIREFIEKWSSPTNGIEHE